MTLVVMRSDGNVFVNGDDEPVFVMIVIRLMAL